MSQITFDTAVKQGITALQSQSKSNWRLGDIAGSVKATYGKDTVKRLAADITAAGYEIAAGTLRNFRTVAKAYPPADRDTGNSFSVYEKFASLDDRMDLLRSKVWTVSDAKTLVESRKPADPPAGKDGKDPQDPPADLDAEITLATANVARLQGELKDAEAKLAKLQAKRDAQAPQVATHNVKGVPEHTADEPRTDCPTCQADGVTPMPAPRRSRTRRTA